MMNWAERVDIIRLNNPAMHSLSEPADRNHVDISSDSEVHFWTHYFDISENQLKYAVNDVGVAVTEIERWMRVNL